MSRKSDVLIVGSGGREHALGWKLAQSSHVSKVYFAPGNGGTSENVPIKQNDIEGLLAFASRINPFTVIGPEEPLSLGIVDAFSKQGLRIFGPTAAAARIEASKAFAKEFMAKAGIPTARFATFTDAAAARQYVENEKEPLVVKADGLAAGKGVAVCDDQAQAIAALESIMEKREFGPAGDKVVVEQRLEGEEASFIAISDGNTVLPLASAQDHKRIFDGDKGPNTGGMGAYSPAPVVDDALHSRIMLEVMEPAAAELRRRGNPFIGFLYAGIMVDKAGRPFVLEFNARMGDPECQPIMVRMKSDLYEYLEAAVQGRLREMPPISWSPDPAVCVVMAAKGYPGPYQKGQVIEGLDGTNGKAMVFHAGTSRNEQGQAVTNGGRVLGITATGNGIEQAAENAYSVVRRISWGENGHQYRTDIARRAIMRQSR